MTVIDGALAKESIVSYLLDCVERNGESNGNNLEQRSPKRRKVSDLSIVLANLVMPLQLNDTSLQALYQCAPYGIHTTEDNNLQVVWKSQVMHVDHQDYLRSRMMLRKDGVLLAENESMRPTNDMDVLSTLARACKANVVECGSIRISYNNNAVKLHMTLYVNLPQSANAANTYTLPLVNRLYPSSISPPSYDTVEEFFRHLQPPVSEKKITASQSPELMPVLTPFQSQNVEWMVSVRYILHCNRRTYFICAIS